MNLLSKKDDKEKKLEKALKENLKKRKQFQRKINNQIS
jgi:hypothetical protein